MSVHHTSAGRTGRHRAVHRNSLRHNVTRAGWLLLRVLEVSAFTAAIAIAVAVLVNPEPVGSRSSLSDSGHPETNSGGLSIERVAAKVLPSVVTLQIGESSRSMMGSGIILTADGLIMTNNHVLTMASSALREAAGIVAVLNDGRTAPFSVIAADPQTDIAIGRLQGVSQLTPIPLGSSASLRVGQPVVAVGAPLGFRGTVTVGIVSALNRLVRPAIDPGHPVGAFYGIQTDAAINPGNSGGALLNTNGELVGVTSAGQGAVAGDGSGTPYRGSIGLNFAIPVDHAARVAAELLANRQASHAWLGAEVSNGGDLNGAKVIAVQSESPAARAGLTSGVLVTQVDNEIIESGDALLAAVEAKDPGSGVTLVFNDRSGDRRTVQVHLGSDLGRQ